MIMKVVTLANEDNRERRLFVQLWKALYVYYAEGDSMRTTEEMLERQEKHQCQEGKGRKNFKEKLVTTAKCFGNI